MWPVTDRWSEIISGDRDQTTSWDVWYDGRAVLPDAPVIAGTWRGSYDGDQVRYSLDLTIDSRDGTLVPVTETDPLAPYGQLLSGGVTVQLPTARMAETVPLGNYRIETAEPEGQQYHLFSRRGVTRWVPTGGVVRVTALDCLADLADARFPGPTAPRYGVLSEVRNIAGEYVAVASDLVNSAVPSTVTYSESRWDAIKALAATQGKAPAPTRTGSMRLLTPQIGSPVWSVTVDRRTLIDATLRHDRQGLVNTVVTSGEQTDGVSPVRGIARETTGSLRADGPLKPQIFGHSSPLYVTNAHAQVGANTILAKKLAERTLRVPFAAAWNPALDILDTIEIQAGPLLKPVPGLLVSLEVDLLAAQMTGEALIPRGALP